MVCTNCKKDFIPKRKTARFCSAKCRVYASRGHQATVKVAVVDKVVNIPVETGGLLFERVGNGVCKVHWVPLDSRKRCLQKGCKFA